MTSGRTEKVAEIENGQVRVFTVGEHLYAVATIPFLTILGNSEKLVEQLRVVGTLFGYGEAQIHIKPTANSIKKSKIILMKNTSYQLITDSNLFIEVRTRCG